MAEEIPYSGIFAMTEEDEHEVEQMPDIEAQLGIENYSYKSFKDEPIHAMEEVKRYLDNGFCIELDEQELKRQFPSGTVSGLALILKEKEGGSIKRRVIIDLLRSGGSRRCKIQERIVLPRVQDVVNSLKYLREQRFGLMLRAQREEWPDAGHCDEIELVSADLADAYCHMAVSEKKTGELCSPQHGPGQVLGVHSNAVWIQGRVSEGTT